MPSTRNQAPPSKGPGESPMSPLKGIPDEAAASAAEEEEEDEEDEEVVLEDHEVELPTDIIELEKVKQEYKGIFCSRASNSRREVGSWTAVIEELRDTLLNNKQTVGQLYPDKLPELEAEPLLLGPAGDDEQGDSSTSLPTRLRRKVIPFVDKDSSLLTYRWTALLLLDLISFKERELARKFRSKDAREALARDRRRTWAIMREWLRRRGMSVDGQQQQHDEEENEDKENQKEPAPAKHASHHEEEQQPQQQQQHEKGKKKATKRAGAAVAAEVTSLNKGGEGEKEEEEEGRGAEEMDVDEEEAVVENRPLQQRNPTGEEGDEPSRARTTRQAKAPAKEAAAGPSAKGVPSPAEMVNWIKELETKMESDRQRTKQLEEQELPRLRAKVEQLEGQLREMERREVKREKEERKRAEERQQEQHVGKKRKERGAEEEEVVEDMVQEMKKLKKKLDEVLVHQKDSDDFMDELNDEVVNMTRQVKDIDGILLEVAKIPKK